MKASRYLGNRSSLSIFFVLSSAYDLVRNQYRQRKINMGKQLKVHKVNTLPGTVEADALYIHKDTEGHLLLSQTDNQGVVVFTTMSSNDVLRSR